MRTQVRQPSAIYPTRSDAAAAGKKQTDFKAVRSPCADFVVSGVRWEYKQLEAATINAVRQNLRKAVVQADRIIIDGRKAGLTQANAIKAVAEQVNAGRMKGAVEVRVLTTSGEYVWRP